MMMVMKFMMKIIITDMDVDNKDDENYQVFLKIVITTMILMKISTDEDHCEHDNNTDSHDEYGDSDDDNDNYDKVCLAKNNYFKYSS